MIESGLHQLITSDARFSTIAATRLYPVFLPTDSLLPSATYQVIAVKPMYDLNSRVNVSQMRLQIDTWAFEYADAKALRDAIISILDNYSGPLSDGSKVFGIQLLTTTDYFEHEALTYRVLTEFSIQFALAS
jgi:Protein of unknown function (DUF3168)